MGRVFLIPVEGPRRFLCRCCRTPLASAKDADYLDEENFLLTYGFHKMVNVIVSSKGAVFCCYCHQDLGSSFDTSDQGLGSNAYVIEKSNLAEEVEQNAPPTE